MKGVPTNERTVSEPTASHSELFGLTGQKRPSTTAGSGPGTGIIGTSGHTGAVNKAANSVGSQTPVSSEMAGMEQGGKSNSIIGSGGEQFTPSQGNGDVGNERQQRNSLVDKLNPLK